MTEHLLIGILALFIAVVLCVIGRPNAHAESPRLLQVSSKPTLFLPIILISATVALAELILWVVGR